MGTRTEREAAKRVAAVDVGNAATSLGVFDGGRLAATWSMTTSDRLTDDEAFAALKGALGFMEEKAHAGRGSFVVEDAVLSSVVPQLTAAWQSALRRLAGTRPLTIGPGVKTGIRMRYRDPAEVGADRMADLAAVVADYEPPVIVVDMGTTTNFEVVDGDGVFLGGIIAPGMALGARSLAREAAKLPVIEIAAPRSVIGTSTREAMQSGVVLGEIARIDGLLDMIARQEPLDYTVVVTGGDAEAIAALLQHDAVADETLTLRGLARLYALNRG